MGALDQSRVLPVSARRLRLPTVLVGLVTIVVSTAGWAYGQLVNPGFEDSGGSLVGWQDFGNTIGNVTVSSLTPRSGSWAASVSGQSSSGASSLYAGIFQGVASAPEAVWTASAYFRHSPGSRLEASNQLVMKVEFYRSFGGVYGTADLISETEMAVLDAASSASVWHKASLSVLAPSDAAEARVAFVFAQQGSAGGTALIDDVSFTTSGDGLGPPEGLAWSLLWHDEFDGDSIDRSKWRVTDAYLIKNEELQYYDPEDVYLENGCLVLRSRQHDPPVTRLHPYGYDAEFEFTSGLVESQGLFSHTYGWIEVRAKLPSTQGLWPAHWMLGESLDEIGWPRCGEVDIMELLGHDVDTVYFSRHWGDPVVHQGFSYSGPDFSQDFHAFAIHWTDEKIDWYVDGSLRHQTTITDAGDTFQKPFYLILNTAVGGSWPGNPDQSTVFPQYHEIDYVRWYVESEPGDFDLDGDVDTDDKAALAACFGDSGSDWNDPACRFFDSDADNDVDCDDWSSFREVWSGPPTTVPTFTECRSSPRRIRRRHTAGPV